MSSFQSPFLSEGNNKSLWWPTTGRQHCQQSDGKLVSQRRVMDVIAAYGLCIRFNALASGVVGKRVSYAQVAFHRRRRVSRVEDGG